MNIFLMRHGVTIWNEKGITQGHTQNHLSKTGIKETILAAEKLENEKIDIIICSPLKRALQTAEIINKYHNVKIIQDIRLIDTDQGIFSRRKYSSLTNYEKKLKKLRTIETKMESYESVIKRVSNFIQTIKNDYNYENILIITHNYIATFIEAIIKKQNINFKNDQILKNFTTSQFKKFLI